MENSTNICDLNDDCLLHIFKYCNFQSLGRVASTCHRLNNVVHNYETVWIAKSKTVLGSNMKSPLMVARSKPFLTPFERCKVSVNWTSGVHERTSVMRYMQCMPWIYLEQDYLYVSKGRRIVKLSRDKDGHIIPGRISAPTRHEDDIAKFVINGDDIFSAGWDGRLCRYFKSSLECKQFQRIHDHEVLGLDTKKDIVATGSRDKTIKIWRINRQSYSEDEEPVTEVGELATAIRVMSLALLPSTNLLVAGLPGTRNIHPLPVYDVQTKTELFKLGHDFVNGGGIIDIYPESENLLLTCGYETRLKLWDVRTPARQVSEWTEPYDNILYTVQSDHSFTIVAGANRSGYFHIWDKRRNMVIQTYHNDEFRSPVYCMQFDASHVYTALNRAVIQHCFKLDCALKIGDAHHGIITTNSLAGSDGQL